MNNVVLTLGGVVFRDMEVPEKISFGGKQRIAALPLIGGGRIVQAMGQEDGTIAFGGIFSGADAGARAQLLDAAVSAGAGLPLAWDGFYYNVVIARFQADYRKSSLIPFSISCVVVDDLAAMAGAAVSSVADMVAADWGAAVSLSGLAGMSLVGMAPGSAAGIMPVQAAVGAMVAGAGNQVLQAGAAMNAASDPAAGVSALGQMGVASAQMAGLAGMSGYVNRVAMNLAGAML